jgi:hypothetical protein
MRRARRSQASSSEVGNGPARALGSQCLVLEYFGESSSIAAHAVSARLSATRQSGAGSCGGGDVDRRDDTRDDICDDMRDSVALGGCSLDGRRGGAAREAHGLRHASSRSICRCSSDSSAQQRVLLPSPLPPPPDGVDEAMEATLPARLLACDPPKSREGRRARRSRPQLCLAEDDG